MVSGASFTKAFAKSVTYRSSRLRVNADDLDCAGTALIGSIAALAIKVSALVGTLVEQAQLF
jgi:hypothetical protein